MMRRKPENGRRFLWAVGESPHWSPTMDWMRLDVSGTIYRQMDNWTWEKMLERLKERPMEMPPVM